jgi:preprotein translocase SecF subunit
MFQLLVKTNFPFMRYRRFAYILSAIAITATVVWLLVNGGPRQGVDFAGGTLIQVRTSRPLAPDQMRDALLSGGLTGMELQQLTEEGGREYLLRLRSEGEGDPYARVQTAVANAFPDIQMELRRTEVVGPRVGRELTRKAFWAVLGSLGGILLYVGLRYEFKFAFGAVMAVFHDVFVTLGLLCFLNREVSLTVVAALLTIAGYSINDTIVVFDRIRERSKALRKETHSRAMDIAVNETLSRTLITSFSVILTSFALLIWGGEVLRDFSLAMVFGVIFGTFSSVYVASALALDTWIWLDRKKGMAAE